MLLLLLLLLRLELLLLLQLLQRKLLHMPSERQSGIPVLIFRHSGRATPY